jgi:hypothetical protein
MAIQDLEMQALPTAGAPPTETPVEAAPSLEGAAAPGELKPELLPPELANEPAIQSVVTGQPPAIYATIEEADSNPLVKSIIEKAPYLMNAGLAILSDENVGVLFNPTLVSSEDIMTAISEGTLDSLAVPINMLSEALGEVTAGAPGAAPPPVVGGGGPNPKVQKARAENLETQPPGNRANPAAGRVINELTKPVI